MAKEKINVYPYINIIWFTTKDCLYKVSMAHSFVKSVEF